MGTSTTLRCATHPPANPLRLVIGSKEQAQDFDRGPDKWKAIEGGVSVPPDPPPTWATLFMNTDPPHDRSMEEQLLGWGCQVADQQHLWLHTAWPAALSEAFFRVGFNLYQPGGKYDFELRDDDGNVRRLAMVRLQRAPPGAYNLAPPVNGWEGEAAHTKPDSLPDGHE